MTSTLDKTKIKPIPAAKTLALVNNFIANTTVFFNNFTEVIEDKISTLSNKITDVEILLAVLEAKLNSIPGLDHIEAAKPPPAAAPAAAPAASQAAPSSSSATAPAPTPSAPAPAADSSSNSSSSEAAAATAAAPEEPPKAPSLADDPDYAPFFRLLKVGVPLFVVQAKASAAGLDPSAFENFNP